MLNKAQITIARAAMGCNGLPFYSDLVCFVETDKQIEKMKNKNEKWTC